MSSPLFALVRKDIKSYFDQPAAYILIVPFVAVLSYVFFSQALLTAEASLRPLFTVDFQIDNPSLPWLLAVFVPAATMKLLAEENRDGTLELLLTHPIRGWIVLLSKFLSGFIFVAFSILATIGIPIAVQTAGNLDIGAAVPDSTSEACSWLPLSYPSDCSRPASRETRSWPLFSAFL